jgi:hypothetical protein
MPHPAHHPQPFAVGGDHPGDLPPGEGALLLKPKIRQSAMARKMTSEKVMRIMCPCGRNLADVTYSAHNPDWTRDRLLVTPRPNVKQDDFRPWHVANQGGVIGSAGRANATPGLIEDQDFDWHDRTYIWRCRKCHATWQRRHEAVSKAWASHTDSGLVRVVLGRDV